MADEADMADDHITREVTIMRSLVSLKPEHEATGECLFFSEPLPEGQRWCDSICRDDFLAEQKRARQQ